MATPASIDASLSFPHSVAQQDRWRERVLPFLPSFSDAFFAALLIWLFVAGASGWKALLADGDTGWHIRAGEYILDTHHVPTHDLFSYSRPSAPWFAWEWLSDVLYAELYRFAGLKGIVLFAGTLIAGYAVLLLRFALWRGSQALVALLCTLLAVGGASMHFLARPHLFTLLFLTISLWMIEADRRAPSLRIWLLVPLMILWTNLHGGFPALLACLGLLVAGETIETILNGKSWAGVQRYALLLAACSAATIVNPFGIELHRHIFAYLQSSFIRDLVQEFQAPTFRSEGQLQFEALLIAALVLCGWLLRNRQITPVLWILFFAHASLSSVRHAPLFVTVAAPMLAAEASALWSLSLAGTGRKSVWGIFQQVGEDIRGAFQRTTVWIAIPVIALAFIGDPIQWPHDFPAELFPVRMIDRHASMLRNGRVFTCDQWGDYFIYRFYPNEKVFFDGRSDFYAESLGQAYLHLLQGAYDADRLLQKFRFNSVLIPVDWPLAQMLKRNAMWRLVEDDGHAILFSRVQPLSSR